MSTSDTWYKRDPRRFLDGVQGMGPELIGAYAVILEILYARGGDMPRDDRHLAGVLGCSLRKARALTEALIEAGKISVVDEKIHNKRASQVMEERRKQRETGVKQSRNEAENRPTSNENNGLDLQNREEKRREDTHPIGCGAGAPEDGFWDFCSRILQRSGIDDRQARSLLGKWTKDRGRDEVRRAVGEAMQTADPVAYVESIMKPQPSQADEIEKFMEERRRVSNAW